MTYNTRYVTPHRSIFLLPIPSTASQVGSLALDFKLAQDDSDYLEYGLTVPDRGKFLATQPRWFGWNLTLCVWLDDALTPIGGKIAAVTASVSDDKSESRSPCICTPSLADLVLNVPAPTKLKASRPSNGSQGE